MWGSIRMLWRTKQITVSLSLSLSLSLMQFLVIYIHLSQKWLFDFIQNCMQHLCDKTISALIFDLRGPGFALDEISPNQKSDSLHCSSWSPSHRPSMTQILPKMTYEPPHDKTNKMISAPSEASDQPGHPPSLIRVFDVRSVGSWGPNISSCGQRRLWPD